MALPTPPQIVPLLTRSFIYLKNKQIEVIHENSKNLNQTKLIFRHALGNARYRGGKDSDARWTKKNSLYKLGYKQHTRTDEEGYIEKLHITPANTHECNHLSPLLEGIAEGTTVYADKGYDSKENRQHLKEHQLLDGIMRKAI